MRTVFEYIHFVKVAEKPKTSVWACLNKRSGDKLGEVKWYGRWRQYCFHPTLELATVFNVGCMEDICSFIRSIPRSKPKSKGEGSER